MVPFVSSCCHGERCYCGAPAEYKVEETIFHDDPLPGRHPLTSYVCRDHMREIMGPAVATEPATRWERIRDHRATLWIVIPLVLIAGTWFVHWTENESPWGRSNQQAKMEYLQKKVCKCQQ